MGKYRVFNGKLGINLLVETFPAAVDKDNSLYERVESVTGQGKALVSLSLHASDHWPEVRDTLLVNSRGTAIGDANCPRCQGYGEYQEECSRCHGEGCDFCDNYGEVWLPCHCAS